MGSSRCISAEPEIFRLRLLAWQPRLCREEGSGSGSEDSLPFPGHDADGVKAVQAAMEKSSHY